MEKVKEHSLDSFFGLEENVMTKSVWDIKEFTSLLESSQGTLEDKLRLMLIACLQPTAKQETLEKFESILQSQGVDLSPYYLIKKNHTNQMSFSVTNDKPPSSVSRSLSSVFGKVADGVRNLLPKPTARYFSFSSLIYIILYISFLFLFLFLYFSFLD